MPFSILYYHMVWATRARAPLITEGVETALHAYIREKSIAIKCPIHAINGTSDHLHVAVSIIPTLAVAEWVKLIKGSSSRFMNQAYPGRETPFAWQDSYGVLTFGTQALTMVVAYIEAQKTHHRENSLYPHLEQVEHVE
jgi:putative transposase